MILITDLETVDGRVQLVDFMPILPSKNGHSVIRMVRGISGVVRMRAELILRFEYGRIISRLRQVAGGVIAIAAPNAMLLNTPIEFLIRESKIEGEFTVSAGQTVPFVMSWYPAHRIQPEPPQWEQAYAETRGWWSDWIQGCTFSDESRKNAVRSLLILKALTYPTTGSIVAAPTTSLPETRGADRNWDYRYCWLRDATFATGALLIAGYRQEAESWYRWLLNTVSHVSQLQTMYGLAGECLLPEYELWWLQGYSGSYPVRIGNEASRQLQLDVFGETMSGLDAARNHNLDLDEDTWEFQKALADHLETLWSQPDNGIWEQRNKRRHYTYSKIMAWAGIDRALRAVECYGLKGPLERWRSLRAAIHSDICTRGYNERLNSFVQTYESDELDASLLRIPLVRFLPATDPRVVGTINAIRSNLMTDGLVKRFVGHEGAFIPCSFWLAEALVMAGKIDEARSIFDRTLALRNDVGLLSEEYNVTQRRMLGNFPLALSHASLINCAAILAKS
jgi:GH15 family glucan-1,4-alpha-glucosidase